MNSTAKPIVDLKLSSKEKASGYSNPSAERKGYKKLKELAGSFHILPDFVIIGASRSGTTALYDYMVQHPDIKKSKFKEIHYFNREFHRGINWYRLFFPLKIKKFFATKIQKKKFVTGEASVLYIHHPHAPKRMFELLPKIKIIVLLRNPIDRAYSSHQYRWKINFKEPLNFDEVIEKENEFIKNEFEKMEKDGNYYSRKFYDHAYCTTGIYVDQLERWFKYFPIEQFLIIQSEEFFSNTPEIMDKIYDFLELPEHRLTNYKKIHSSNYKEKMNQETRKKLVEFFKPHNERLYKLLGTNFHWDE